MDYIYSFCIKDMKKYIIREQINDLYYNYSYCIESFYNFII